MDEVSNWIIQKFKKKAIKVDFERYVFYFIHKKDTFYDILMFNKKRKSYELSKKIFPDICWMVAPGNDSKKLLKELKGKINSINDNRLVFALKLRYFSVSKAELIYYSKIDNITYIPHIRDKKEYIVDYRTFKRKYVDVLFKSGYRWLCVPCYSMENKTHDYDTISFGYKSITNAAPIDSPNVISYKEFFDLVNTKFYS